MRLRPFGATLVVSQLFAGTTPNRVPAYDRAAAGM